MSVSGIPSSSFFSQASEGLQSRMQQVKQEFQQLGQDLQSGNLAAAQSDFATLQQFGPQQNSTATLNSNPISQDLTQLAKDLQSGNLAAAQKDYATIQQDVQSQTAAAPHRHAHHHHSGGAASSIMQEFAQLGQALSSGNLSAAQQTYGLLQQELPSFPNSDSQAVPATSSTGGLSLTA